MRLSNDSRPYPAGENLEPDPERQLELPPLAALAGDHAETARRRDLRVWARASPRLKPLSRRCCRKRRAATDLYRRRRVTAQPRRPDRRRQQPAVREGRDRPRRGTDERSYRPGTGQARSAGARTRQRCRHRLGTAGFDRSHRAMGQGRRSPRHRAGADHRGRNQAEVELTQQDAQNAMSSVMGGHSRRRRRSLRSPIDPAIHVLF